MEYTFVADYDYECPYCHARTDYVEGTDEEKQCTECKRKVKVYTTKEV